MERLPDLSRKQNIYAERIPINKHAGTSKILLITGSQRLSFLIFLARHIYKKNAVAHFRLNKC